MPPITFTVFIGVYNASKYIVETIDSVLAQTFVDFELLIIDDGSTDDSLAKMTKFKDPRIRLLSNDVNKGIIYTRNRGCQEARGNYICVLDSDDVAMPDRLAIQYQFLLAHPKVKVLGGHAYLIDDKSNIINTPIKVPFNNDLKERLLFSNVFVNSTIAIQKDVIGEVGGYQLQLAEDYDLFQKIAEKHAIANCDHFLVKYRVHDTNISTTAAEAMRTAVLHIAETAQNKLGIPHDKTLLKAHMNLIQDNYVQLDIDDCQRLFIEIIKQNKIYNCYQTEKLRTVIAEKWFTVIRNKKTSKAISYFFTPQLFNWKYTTFKQLRKIIKQSLFHDESFALK